MEATISLPEKFAARQAFYQKSVLPNAKPRGFLFCGDSGFDPEHFWTHFHEDVPLENAYDLAISGTRVCDWTILKNSLILPLDPAALILHLGGNDFNVEHHTPWRVFDDLTALVLSLSEALPRTCIYLFALEPKPATSRCFHTNYGRNTLNPMLAEWCKGLPRLHFVDTAKAFLCPNGTVDETLFKEDHLHPADRVYPEIFLPSLRAAGCAV